jgi:hypothetical protein
MRGERRDTGVFVYGPLSRRRRVGLVALLGTVFVLVAASAAFAADVTVTPASGTAGVGQPYCVTATVSAGQGGEFVFTAEPTSGSAATPNPSDETVPADSNNQAQFCFTSATPGDVLITAVARGFNIGQQPSGTATVTFTALPTDQDQCKHGGWQTFGIFKNQGDCVSFVATGGKNPPGGQ